MKMHQAMSLRRMALTGLTLASGALFALTAQQAPGFSLGQDFGGVPEPLSNTPPTMLIIDGDAYSAPGIPWIGPAFTQSLFPFASSVFNAAGGTNVDDIDVILRIRHPKVDDLEVYLAHGPGGDDTVTVPLIVRNGCEEGDFPSHTVFNQDVAAYFDSQAQAAVDFSCDRTIPTIQGRLLPTTRNPYPQSVFDHSKVETGLGSLSGVDSRGPWTLIVHDYGDTGARAEILEFQLIINGAVHADLAPRERAPTAPAAQSGNNIVTEQDYVTNAFHLLGYNTLDMRGFSRQPDDLSDLGAAFTSAIRSSGSEFLRLDSAPASSGGDGVISVADFVQANRYAASLDPLTSMARGPLSRDDRALFARILDGSDTLIRGDSRLTPVSIMMRSKNSETEVGFGMRYDPELLELVEIQRGPCLPANAIFQVDRTLDTEEGLAGVRIGVSPDETFLCDFEPKRPLLGMGDPEADVPPAVGEVEVNDDGSRVVGQELTLRTELDGGVNFSGFLPRLRVAVILENPTGLEVDDYKFDFAINKAKLRLEGTPLSMGDYPSAPSLQPQPGLSDQNMAVYRLSASSPGSGFTDGVLIYINLEVLPGLNFGTVDYQPSTEAPSFTLRNPTGGGSNSIINPETGDPNLLQYFKVILNDSQTEQITGTTPPISEIFLHEADGDPCTSGTVISVDVQVLGNLVTMVSYGLELEYDTSVLELYIPDAADANDPRTTFNGFNEYPEVTFTQEIGDLRRIGFAAADPKSTYLNRTVVRFHFTVLEAPASGDYEIRLNRFQFNGVDGITQMSGDTVSVVACMFGLKSAGAPVADDGPKVSVTSGNLATLTSSITGVREEDGRILATLAVSASQTMPETVTNYRFLLTYDSFRMAPDVESPADGGDGFGVAPDLSPFENQNPFGGLPNDPSSNYESVVVDGRNAASTFTNGTLFTMDFEIVKPGAPVSIRLSSIYPVNENIEIARAYFRALPGAGTVATTLQFEPNPFFDGLAARNPLGAPIYMSFIDAGLTVIDPDIPRPRVHVVDTVMNADSEGNVLIALESVGVENAAGFTVNFDPDDLELISVGRGRDVPPSAFFFTNPDVGDVSSANDTGQLRMLVALQAGSDSARTFDAGQRILANLRFRSRALGPGDAGAPAVSTELFFTELADTREVVDANAIPLETRFPTGTVRIAGPECEYNITPLDRNFSTSGGSGSFDVASSSGCPWVATTADDWIVLEQGRVVTGNGRVTYSVLPNAGEERVGTIEAGGQVHVVIQAGCAFVASPAEDTFSGDGGTGAFTVLTDEICQWQVQSQVTWIQIETPRFNTGTREVVYTVSANVGAPREGRIVINDGGAGQEFIVRQEICNFALTPAESPMHEAGGDTGSFSVAAQAFCTWTAVAADSWVVITSDPNGAGAGEVTYQVLENFAGSSRTSTIAVADQLFTVRQVGLADCDYVITPDREIFPASGGDGSFQLTTDGSCPWQISVDESWVTLLSASSGSGSTTVSFRVAVNLGPTRFATITVGGEEFTVQQFGGSRFTFDFHSDPEGWTPLNVDPADWEFTLPIASHSPDEVVLPGGVVKRGRLNLETQDNINTFGFWSSPLLTLGQPTDENSLFLATYEFTTDESDRTSVPTVRMRVSSADFSQTNEMWVTSSGNGNHAPRVAGRTYRHIFDLPPNTQRFRMFYDVLNFDPADAAMAKVSLERVTVEPLDGWTAGSRSEGQFVFADNAQGFVQQTAAPAMRAARFAVDNRGLLIGAPMDMFSPTETVYGSWHRNTNIILEGGRAYRGTFRVTVRSREGGQVVRQRVPNFRVRLNTGEWKSGSVVHLNSTDENSNIPTVTEAVTYQAWLVAEPELAGSTLRLSFDYIYPEGSQDDIKIDVILEQLTVRSFVAPEPTE